MIFFGLKYFLGMFSFLPLSFLSLTIVNIALFVLNFLKLTARRYFDKSRKTFRDIEGHLPSFAHLVSRQINQWKSKKLILQGKGYASISPDGSSELTWLPLRKIQPKGAPNIQTRDETTKTPG